MAIKSRYDFVLIFDVQDGNPNGDPDAGNLPRVDAETGNGLVTDVSLKRKIRNYVELTQAGTPGMDIFIRERAVLNSVIDGVVDEVAGELGLTKEDVEKKGEAVMPARARMCERYFDVRTFGAVMSTGKNAGQVRGPVQLTFGRSVDPIVSLDHTVTRMAVATEKESQDQAGGNRTMGRKSTVPYGLYVAHGFVSAPLARQTGFSEGDLEILWDALMHMFEHDRSAARGLMSTRRLIVFEHKTELGNAPAAELFDRVEVRRVATGHARSFKDYEVNLDGMPVGSALTIVPVD